MTRTIFLITSVTVTALAVAVPSALGKGRGVDQSNSIYLNQRPNEFEHGQGGALGSPQRLDAVSSRDANERSTIPFPPTVHDHGDATQAKLVAQTPTMEIVRDHGDATQAKLVAQTPSMEIVRDHGDATQAKLTQLSGPVVARENSQRAAGQTDPLIVRDHGSAEQAKLDAQSSGTTPIVQSTSGSELDWSQLAIGFGVGMLLILGLVVGVQLARNERLAH